MASLVSDLEYDVFISYRKNDNKYDGWVTEFVQNLNKELEATIKNKLAVYFDENPVDGVLETHDVDKTIANKLKSLIFIPILSQTYCDTASYAWQYEFLAFCKMSKEDHYGSELVLNNGNVVRRILPVRVHELDAGDLKLLEDEMGGPLRGIDFIFKEPGVNRPLRPEDDEDKNLNKIRYRNQVNKVANSIKDIIYSTLNAGRQDKVRSRGEFQLGTRSAGNSIAILPFVNMSNDPEQEYFSDGISEEIINMLVQVPELKVAGRTSAFSFKNKNEDLRSIGEKLNVNNILEGSVRKSGNRVRITAQLIEAATGFHIWSQKYDRELNDIFNIQDEISTSIVESLQITLSGKSTGLKDRHNTRSAEAYQLYLKGMSNFYKRGIHMFDGLRYFEEALAIDPGYALAHVGLADSYTMLCLHSYMAPEEALPKATKASMHALQLEPDLAEAHNAIAIIANLFEFNWQKAESEYIKALELKPSYIQARCWYSFFFLQYVRQDSLEAIHQAEQAIEYDGMSSYAQSMLCAVASFNLMHDVADKAGKRAVEFDPDSFSAWHILAGAHYAAGNFSDAIEEYKHALKISGRHNWSLYGLQTLYTEPGKFQNKIEAEYLYKELITKARMGYVAPSILAIASANVGKTSDAIAYIKEAINRHDPFTIQVQASWYLNQPISRIIEIEDLLRSIYLTPQSAVNKEFQA